MKATEAITSEPAHGYEEFLEGIQLAFSENQAGPLFTTDAAGLFGIFLAGLPEEYRQHYTCRACQRFVDTFGGLVTIDDEGLTHSAVWPVYDVPDFFQSSVYVMIWEVMKAKVTGVFLDSRKVWGQPETGPWFHMSVELAKPLFHASIKDAGQMMAEKKQDFLTLTAGLLEYPATAVDQAVRILEADVLYRGEKTLGAAKFLKDIHDKRAATKNSRTKENLTWRAVGNAPVGFCHVKSGMIGTLLDDIVEGFSVDAIQRRFAEKMNPLQYQRPQAPPSSGNIAQAEKIVEQLGIAASLRRRYARLEEVPKLWEPPIIGRWEPAPGGVFSHLKPKGKNLERPALDLPCVTMTWEKFAREILPGAEGMELRVPSGDTSFGAFTTATIAEAPPIIQWDSEECRNPFGWYLYSNGSSAFSWGLAPGNYHTVDAIVQNPSGWNGGKSSFADGVLLALQGAKDSRESTLALFPELLKSELRAIRATIEAYSRAGKLEGKEEASVCGLMLNKAGAGAWDCKVRVTTALGRQDYRIDRWD